MFTYLIPCRNNAELLEDTLNSIHFDNEFVDEVIVIDDYSDQFISSSISFKHDKLNIYRNKSKPGLTSALNYGIDKVKSIYVLRMDSDDLDLPTRISTTIQALKDYPNADILSFAKEDFPNKNITNVHWSSDNELRTLLTFGNPLYHPTTCLKTRLLSELRYVDFHTLAGNTILGGEDYLLWCRAFLSGAEIRNIPQVVIRYRIWSGQVSKIRNKPDVAAYISQWFETSNNNLRSELWYLFKFCYYDKERRKNKEVRNFLDTVIRRRFHMATSFKKPFWVIFYALNKLFSE